MLRHGGVPRSFLPLGMGVAQGVVYEPSRPDETQDCCTLNPTP